MNFPRECEDPSALQALGRDLAEALREGGVLGLEGDLGAGKTELVKGLAAGLGVPNPVTSPTFTLLHEYTWSTGILYHFDFYRVEKEEEILRLGWDELLEEPGAILVIEWADRYPDLMPSNCLRLLLEVCARGTRRVSRLRS